MKNQLVRVKGHLKHKPNQKQQNQKPKKLWYKYRKKCVHRSPLTSYADKNKYKWAWKPITLEDYEMMVENGKKPEVKTDEEYRRMIGIRKF
jgi:hypothetical protein